VSAAYEIAELDRALQEDGENIVLRRVKGTSLATVQNVDVTCRAFVRGYDPNELVGGISQQDVKVILSPTQIDAADWPADEADSTSPIDERIPRKNRGDRAVIAGRVHSVEAAKGILIDGILVRIDMQCRGLA
jgi:hypothetical protein